jgi:hypothetical protein
MIHVTATLTRLRSRFSMTGSARWVGAAQDCDQQVCCFDLERRIFLSADRRAESRRRICD